MAWANWAGLGKLGTPMAAVMAHKGNTVVGVDINAEFVNAINEGRPPVNEPQLADM
ncbi:MAG: UDP-glucose 6-dehydrogenase, partial [Candidatus Solibacter sp.]|nr:UDP-glucose 6-dehydrogenase [Candidatus Solibacter sp.]